MTHKAPLTVMLVEDSEDDQLIVKRAFKALELGHELIIAATAEQAWETLAAGKHVDLLLMDLNLPGLSGIELLRRLRQDPHLCTLPVTVLSASDRERDISEAYESGANHYIVKPIRFEEFMDLVRRWNDYWTRLGRLPPLA